MLKCNFRFSMLCTDFLTNFVSNSTQNTDILIRIGNTRAENKGLECTSIVPCFLGSILEFYLTLTSDFLKSIEL